MAMPRRFKVPSPSPVRLSLEALMTMASVPDARGDERIAYAFVPWATCPIQCLCFQSQPGPVREQLSATPPRRGRERVRLRGRGDSELPELVRQERGRAGSPVSDAARCLGKTAVAAHS